MTQEGWSVTIVCSDGPLVSQMRQGGYRVIVIPIARSSNPLAALISLLRLVRLFHRERFDIVHVHTPVAALIGRVASSIARVPRVVYTAHGFYFHDQMPTWKKFFFIWLERFGGLFTDLLFTQSAEDARDAARLGIMSALKVVTIGNGVDSDRFDGRAVEGRDLMRAQLGIPVSAPVIGIIARVVAEKGYNELLDAALNINESYPDVYFLLIGDRLKTDHSGSVESSLSRVRLRLGSRLVEVGFRADTPALLSAMDIYVLPSYREGMPRSIIEAMFMQLPVVATDIRGSREEVVDRVTGLLVPTRDVRALVQALRSLLDDSDGAVRMGAAGRIRAMSLYDESRVIALQIKEIRKRFQVPS